MGGYTQLTQEEQYQIYNLKKVEYNQTEIEDMLQLALDPSEDYQARSLSHRFHI